MEIRENAVITDETVREAEKTLMEYRAAKAPLEARILENEQWYRLRHWNTMRKSGRENDPEPASAWLLNCIANKHADAMDNFPEPYVLPREEDDTADAEALSAILPVVLEQNEYEQVYSDVWWSKLKAGTGVTGVFWNPGKQGGLGDIDIRGVDILRLYWEPGVSDIQASRNLFHVESVDNDILEETWPELRGRLTGGAFQETRYLTDAAGSRDRSVVVDWYYKRKIGGRTVVHLAKFVNGILLYASENEENTRERGFYDHGKYPFVFDAQFVEADSPAGFGFIDVCKQPQMYIDRLNQVILKSALMAARPRFFIRSDGAINEQEYADWTRDFVHYQGGSTPQESIKQIDMRPLDASLVAILNGKIEELKETSGNRDFSQGSSANGVTAASAIMALQDAGGKLARDMLKSSYRAFTRVCVLCVELIRQFYDDPRCFRILGGEAGMRYIRFDNRRISARGQKEFGLDLGGRLPVFDIKIRPQRSAPMVMSQRNELAKEFYSLGFFNSNNAEQALGCIDMMEFEGKGQLVERVRRGQTQRRELDAMREEMLKMAKILDAQNGTTLAKQMTAAFAGGNL